MDIHANFNQKTQNNRELGLDEILLPVKQAILPNKSTKIQKKKFLCLVKFGQRIAVAHLEARLWKSNNFYLHLIICVNLTNKKNLMALSDQIILNNFTMKNDYWSLSGDGEECIKLCNVKLPCIIYKTYLSKVQDLIHQFWKKCHIGHR